MEENKSNGSGKQAPASTATVECSACKEWRIKYKDMEKRNIKLSLCYTELMMKNKDLVRLLTGVAYPNDETVQLCI